VHRWEAEATTWGVELSHSYHHHHHGMRAMTAREMRVEAGEIEVYGMRSVTCFVLGFCTAVLVFSPMVEGTGSGLRSETMPTQPACGR
jgi:hypothetical protein